MWEICGGDLTITVFATTPWFECARPLSTIRIYVYITGNIRLGGRQAHHVLDEDETEEGTGDVPR